MTEQYQMRSTTKTAVMDNLKDVELIIPSSGAYPRVVILRYQKGTVRVLKETLTPYKSKDPDQPNLMQLMAEGDNELKSITTSSSTDAETVLDERDAEIKKMKKYKHLLIIPTARKSVRGPCKKRQFRPITSLRL